MRPHPDKCGACDFRAICPKQVEDFKTDDQPPPLIVPGEAEGKIVNSFDIEAVNG